MKIFGVGLNKTGTSSAHKACQLLGLRSSHDHAKNYDNILAGYAFDEADAYWDGPLWEHALALHAKYPAAVFFNTTRLLDWWVVSRLTHVLYNRLCAPSETWRHIDTIGCIAEYQQQQDMMRALRSRGARVYDMQLTKNVEDRVKWQWLCVPLGLAVPDKPFPRENSGQWRLQQVMKALGSPPQHRRQARDGGSQAPPAPPSRQ